jgi:hypothetical protein
MKKESSKRQKNWYNEEPKIKKEKNVKKNKRHSSKENLKDIVQGNLDYDDYMEMEDWSDSR